MYKYLRPNKFKSYRWAKPNNILRILLNIFTNAYNDINSRQLQRVLWSEQFPLLPSTCDLSYLCVTRVCEAEAGREWMHHWFSYRCQRWDNENNAARTRDTTCDRKKEERKDNRMLRFTSFFHSKAFIFQATKACGLLQTSTAIDFLSRCLFT